MSSEKKFRIQNGLDVAGEVFVNGINIVGADGVLNEASYQTAVQAMIDATVAQGVDQGSIGQAVDKAVSDLADAAPATLDTLNELAAALGDDANFATSMTNALNTKLNSANNLSDVADPAAARSNLGLGTAATAATTSFATAAQGAKADAAATASDLTALETQISSGVATLAQGALADTAVQPEDFFTVADGTTTSYVADWSDPSWSYGASQSFSKSNDIVVDLRVSPSGYKVATFHDKTYISYNQTMQTSVRFYRPDGSVQQIYASSYTNGPSEYWGPKDGSRVVSADITDTHIFIAYSMPSGAGYRVFSYDDTTVTDLYGHRDQSKLIHSDQQNDGKNVTIRSVGDQGHLVVFSGGNQYPYRAGIHNWMTITDSSLYVPGYQFTEVDVHSESGWVFVSGYTADKGVTGQNVLTGQTIKLDPVATHNQEGYRLGVSVGSKYVVVSDASGNDDVRVYEVGTQNIVASIPNKNGQSSQWGGAQLQYSDIATNGDLVIIGSPYGDNTTFYMFDMSSSSPTTHFETFGMSTAYSNGSSNTPPEVEISDNHEILVYGLKNATLALGPTSAVVTPNVDASTIASKVYVDNAVANADVDLSGYSTTAEMNTAIAAIPSTDLTPYSTTTEMNSAITAEVANVVDAAPAALDTLNELAAALGDDANFASTVTTSIATKADDAATTAALATKSNQTDLNALESLIKGQDVVGTSILISAPYAEHSDGTQRAGQTYLYNTADTSSPVLTIESADPREWMTQGSNDKPYSTTINQYGFVAIGDHNYTGGGRVSIFNPDGSLVQHLLPSSPNSSLNENFGKTVVWSESGDKLFVSAKNEDSTSIGGDKVEGAIYAYNSQYSNNNQSLTMSYPTKLSPSRNFNAVGGNQWFGEDNSSIVSVGRKLYVGFVSYDGSTQNQGRVYIYNIDDLNASPTEIATQSTTNSNSFGLSVAANSTHWAAVAYSGATGTPKVIHVFDSSNNQLIGTIQKPNIETNDNWIQYIEMTDSHIISIGAGLSGLDNNGMYVWPLSSISSQPTYVARYGSSSDGFNVHAKSVIAKGNIILLGYHEFNDGNVNGQLHIYDVNDLSTPQVLNQPYSTVNESRFGMSASIGYTMTSPAPSLATVATEITPAINELRSEISALSGTDTSLTDSISANASAIAAETAARTAAIAAIPTTDLTSYSTTAEMNTAISNVSVDLSGYSTTAEMNTAITAEVAATVDAAPAALDTLNELAAALGDDANFASTVTTSLAAKADVTALADKASQVDLDAETTRATSAETINNQAIAILQNQVSGISTSSGSTDIEMTADVDMTTNKITNLGTPTSGTDAATKAYVDSGVAGVDLSGYTDTSGMTSAISTAKSEAISTASADATTKADQAETDAKAYADQVVAATVDAAPAALDTLNELAAALGDDANFASTVTTSLAAKADDVATTAALATKADASAMTTALAAKADASSVSSIEDFLNGNAGDGAPTVESTITSPTGNNWGQKVITYDDVVLVRDGLSMYVYSPNDLVNSLEIFGASSADTFEYDPVTKILMAGNAKSGTNQNGFVNFFHLSELIAGTGPMRQSYVNTLDSSATADPNFGRSIAFADGKFYAAKYDTSYGTTPMVHVWNASDIVAQMPTGDAELLSITPITITAPPAADNRGYWGYDMAAAGNYFYVFDMFYSQVSSNAGAIFVYNTSDNQLVTTLECTNDVKYFVTATENYYAVHWHGVNPTKTRVYQAGTNTLVAELDNLVTSMDRMYEFDNYLSFGFSERVYDQGGNLVSSDKGVAIYDTSDFSKEPIKIISGNEFHSVSSAQKLYAYTNPNVQVYDVSSLGGFSLQDDLEALITANTSAISTETSARQSAIVTAKSEAVALAASDATTKADAAQAAAISTASADATSKADAAQSAAAVDATTKADQAEADAKAYADQVVASTVDAAPDALNTLNELAAALGDDANFASSVTSSIATKADTSAMNTALDLKADTSAMTTALATKADASSVSSIENFLNYQNGATQTSTISDQPESAYNLTKGSHSNDGSTFGKSLKVSNDFVFVGAPDSNMRVGALWVYPKSDMSNPVRIDFPGLSTWHANHTPEFGAVFEFSESSKILAVGTGTGSPWNDPNYGSTYINTGAVWFFDLTNISNVTLTHSYIPQSSNSNVGSSIAYDNGKWFVGHGSGSQSLVSVFDENSLTSSPSVINEPTVFTTSGSHFGRVVYAGNGYLYVPDREAKNANGDQQGAMHIYDTSTLSRVTSFLFEGADYSTAGSVTYRSGFVGNNFVYPVGPTIHVTEIGTSNHISSTVADVSGTTVDNTMTSSHLWYENTSGKLGAYTLSDLTTPAYEIEISDFHTSSNGLVFDSVTNEIYVGQEASISGEVGQVGVFEISSGFSLKSDLETLITANTSAISTETSARTTAISTLQGEVNALSGTDTTLTASITANADAITANSNAISAETTARTSAISAETTARESAVTSAISTASSDATTKANAAEADAIATASADATSKANAAQSAAVSTASSDATAKANAAQSAAEATASADATTKADAAQAAAAVDATTKSDAALVSAQTYADNAASTAVANVIDTAPASLDTLNELAAALGDDANFASTVTTSLATKANTADVATAAQGVKADSALQPGDAVSLTVDNSDKLDGQQSSHFRIDIYDINGNIVN